MTAIPQTAAAATLAVAPPPPPTPTPPAALDLATVPLNDMTNAGDLPQFDTATQDKAEEDAVGRRIPSSSSSMDQEPAAASSSSPLLAAKPKEEVAVEGASASGNRATPKAMARSPSKTGAPWCRCCGATETGRWRGGPQGKSTLCNACGLRWKNEGCPAQGFEGGRPSKRARRSRTIKKPASTTKSRAASPPPAVVEERIASVTDFVCQQDTIPYLLCARKKYLKAGMYSTHYKQPSNVKDDSAPAETKEEKFRFPLPIHQGTWLLHKEKEFSLPPNILEEHTLGRLHPTFTLITRNITVGGKARRKRHDAPPCQCKPPADGTMACGENCLNRMMFYECDPDMCHAGDQCSNRRFQNKAYIEELEPFPTMQGRGWGLRTLVDIKRGQLITEYCGEVITQEMCDRRMRTVYKHKQNFYFLEYATGLVIDAGMKGSLARFINHSCEPNCHIEKWSLRNDFFVGVFAARDIAKGEELFYDYNFTTFGGGQDQPCYCGSNHCRGTMGRKPPGNTRSRSNSN